MPGPLTIDDPIAAELCSRWEFAPVEELAGGVCSRVYADAARVLKVPFQGEERDSGARATVRLASIGGPRVDAWDEATGAVLMERLVPGSLLSDWGTSEAAKQEVVCRLIEEVAALEIGETLPVEKYFLRPNPLMDRLIETTRQTVFLHGDLHHLNVLRDQSTWRAIDPKGLCGDPNFEVIAYLRNPHDVIRNCPDFVALSRARILRFANRLGLDPWRMAAWALVDAQDIDEIEAESHPWTKVLRAMEHLEREFRPDAAG